MLKKRSKPITNEERERIIDAYVNGSNATSIARILALNARTVQSIVKKYIDGEDYRRKPKVGPREATKVILPEVQRKFIQSCIDEDLDMPIKEISKRLQNEMGVSVSERVINMNVSEFNYSLRRVDPPPQSNDITFLELRAFYADTFFNDIVKFIDSKVIFINEATFNVLIRINKNLTEKGKRDRAISRARTINASMCCAMSKHGIIEHKSQLRRFFTDTFNQFIKSVIEKLTKINISEAIIIMDNAYIEKDPSIKKLIISKGHRLICLPPNSSFLNPVEHMYTKWIELIKAKEAQTEKEFFGIIDNILSEITPADCIHFFEQMLSYLSRCLNREEILE
ncbi:hypothetical protein K502DRAFT_135501 [Neoconidiobolus thromboides FSU 785]|nr:hypothetical protein K502DRAFT_135501 [Neoconidiobolus thromboides FSU 785]